MPNTVYSPSSLDTVFTTFIAFEMALLRAAARLRCRLRLFYATPASQISHIMGFRGCGIGSQRHSFPGIGVTLLFRLHASSPTFSECEVQEIVVEEGYDTDICHCHSRCPLILYAICCLDMSYTYALRFFTPEWIQPHMLIRYAIVTCLFMFHEDNIADNGAMPFYDSRCVYADNMLLDKIREQHGCRSLSPCYMRVYASAVLRYDAFMPSSATPRLFTFRSFLTPDTAHDT